MLLSTASPLLLPSIVAFADPVGGCAAAGHALTLGAGDEAARENDAEAAAAIGWPLKPEAAARALVSPA